MRPDGEPYGLIRDGVIRVVDGVIEWIGHSAEPFATEADQFINGDGRFLSPGLIDCHTHLVYGGNRAAEWEMRLTGVPYEEISRQGGGIISSVKATRAASEEELFQSAAKRLRTLVRQGVTAVEIKSGYGLNTESELKMLRAVERIGQELPVTVFATLLAAHATPPEFSGRADDYIALVCNETIPAATELCDAVDVFCESIAFDLNQTRRVFEAAVNAGLAIKVHAEQLTYLGGGRLAANMGALSADHLEYLSTADCDVLGENGTVATLLPGAFYNLQEAQKPPVDALRSAGVPIAIATDTNPGSSPVGSILLMSHMASTLFGLTPEESIAGLTRNAAKALGVGGSRGMLAEGYVADFAVWDVHSPAELAYGIGHNPCVAVYKSGRPIFNNDSDSN